jgi:uncharacterized protein (TIGR02118 family)
MAIKLVFVLRKRDDVTAEEFHRYWLDVHGPLVRGIVESLGGVATRYVQSHTIDTPLNAAIGLNRGEVPPWDGIAEVTFNGSLDEFAALLGSPEFQPINAALIEDEAKFIDFGRSSIFLTEEQVVFQA